MKNKIIYLCSLAIVIILSSVLVYTVGNKEEDVIVVAQDEPATILDGKDAVVYKSPSCGCCVGFSKLIEDQKGVNVEIVEVEDLNETKKKYNIPRNMESCHTTVIGDYFFEGHIPFEVIEKVLEEKPDIDGLALPNMPSGTPGMPGAKTGPYEIYQLKDGVETLYISI